MPTNPIVTPADAAHKLYIALMAWRTNGGQRADIWRITEEAEAAYAAAFPDKAAPNKPD
jgi:hypothetical protein